MTRLRAVTIVAVALLVAALTLLTAPVAGAVTGQYWVSKLALSKVWKITRGGGVTVAVIDTGVPPTADLGDRLLRGTDLVSASASGQVDPGQSTGGGGNLSHGQNIAEIIAGTGHDGLTGIAPRAKILPVKASIGTGHATGVGATAQGIRYAVSHGAQVINLSLGSSGSCDAPDAAAIKYAYQHDVIVVAGAGNDGAAAVDAPANCTGALAVSGISSDAAIWSGSNFGPQVDLANFAVNIPAVTFTGRQGPVDGTSPATAFTSGEIALLRAKFPDDSARQIVTRLLWGIDTLSKVTTGTRVNDHVGYGVPVPLSALTAKVPSYAPNPIYDALAKELGPGSGNTSSSPSGSSSSSESGGASEPSIDPGPTSSSVASGGNGGGVSPVLIVVIVVVVVAAIGVAVAVSRSRRRRPPPGYGPPGGYGPPPGGYGPPGR